MIYIYMWAMLAFFSLFDFYRTKLKNIYKFSLFILFIFAGTRYRIGGDWYPYQIYSDNIENIFQILNGNTVVYNGYLFEIGFKILNVAIKTLGGGFQTLVLIYTAFDLLVLNKILQEKITNKNLFVLVYYSSLFFVLEFALIRQAIAFFIFIVAILSLNKNQNLKYLILCVLSWSFHKSSILAYLFYGIVSKFKVEITRKKIIIATLVLIILTVLPLNITRTILEKFILYFPEFIKYKINYYLEVYSEKSKGMVFLEKVILLTIYCYKYKTINYYDKDKIFQKLYFLDLIIGIIFVDFHIMVARFRIYFQFGAIFIYSHFFKNGKEVYFIIITYFYTILLVEYRLKPLEAREHMLPYKSLIIEYLNDNFEESKQDSLRRWERAIEITDKKIEMRKN